MKKLYTTIIIALVSINTFAQAPSWSWAKSGVGMSNGYGNCISTDLLGNTYVTGFFKSRTFTLGTIVLSNADTTGSTNDIFIAKFDATGNPLWAKNAGGSADDAGYALVNDHSGNLYVTGTFYSSSIVFGTDTLQNSGPIGTSDLFIMKYNPAGNVQWAKSTGGNSYDDARSIIIDKADNVYITGGFFSPSLFCTTDTLINTDSSTASPDIFLIKYTPNGTEVWAKSFGGSLYDYGNSISADTTGNLVIIGTFYSPTIVFGITTLINNDNTGGTDDVLIVKFDSSGNVLWAKSGGGNNLDEAQSIATDLSGNVFITGEFNSSSINFGSTLITNTAFNTFNIFVVKYNAIGTIVWAKSEGGNNDDQGISIATDLSGNVYLTGIFNSPSVVLGSSTLINASNYDLFVVKYNPPGIVLWAENVGGIDGNYSNCICTDAIGNIYITGGFSSNNCSFGSTLLTNTVAGSLDFFIAKAGSATVGVNENKNTDNLENTISPNPFTFVTTIYFSEEQRDASIKITDILGKEIRTINLTGKQLTIEKGEMSNGIYFVQIIPSTGLGNGKVVNRKIVIQ